MPLDFSKLTPLKSEPYPYNADQEAWLVELETTDKKQGFGLLRSMDDKYCCLGIACETLGLTASPVRHPFNETITGYQFEAVPSQVGNLSYLPGEAVRRLRMRSMNGRFEQAVMTADDVYHALTGMNDRASPDSADMPRAYRSHMLSFKDIAAYIRFDPWNVFLPPEDAEQKAAA